MKRHKTAKMACLIMMLIISVHFDYAASFDPVMCTSTGSRAPEPDSPHGNFDQPPMFTGTTTHRYELRIPPGTNGMAPKLALVYRSTNGNGWFGMGWEMEGFAFIERDVTKRVPGYDNSDSYILNIDGLTYELVRDGSNTNGIGYYHTKCETWMRIHYNGTHWIINTKDGRELRFGYDSSARVPIVGHSLIRLWAVDRIKDTCGNYLSYTYYLDAPNGEYYPLSIQYTQNTKNNLAKVKTVTFIRENRTDNVRPAARWMLSRIKEITVTIGGVQAERYRFTYRYGKISNRSLLASISRYGSGGTAETTTMTYASDSGSLTWTRKEGTKYPPHGKWEVKSCGDLDGDGLKDFLDYYYDTSTSTHGNRLQYYWMNKGDGTYERRYAPDLFVGGIPQMVDIDGNGREDFYTGVWRNSKPYVNHWGEPREWVYDSDWEYAGGYTNSAYADFNNDSVVDEMLYTGKFIYLSSPSTKGFTGRQDYLVLPAPYTLETDNCAIADFNGDWWPDITFGRETLINNTAGSWVNDSTWRIPTTNAVPASAWSDQNGDGLADFTYQNSVYINDTHGWTKRPEWATASGQQYTVDINDDGLPDVKKIFDYFLRLPNGTVSGTALNISDSSVIDWVYINDDPFPDIVNTVTHEVYLSNAKPDLLVSVKRPTGGTTSWEYRRIPVYPYLDTGLRRGLTTRIYAIAKIVESDATNRAGTNLQTLFEYPEGQFNRDKKFFMGFPWVKITYPNGEYSITTFSQKIASAGRIETTKYYSAGKLVYEEKGNWAFREIAGSPKGYAIILDSLEKKWYGTTPKQTKITYDYDAYGNITREVDQGDLAIADDNYTITRDYINRNDGSYYLIGYVKREQVADANGSIIRDKLFWYDGLSFGQVVKGLLTEEKSWLDHFNNAPTCSAAAFASANTERPNADPLDPHPLMTYGYDAFGNRISTVRHNVRPNGTWEDQEETIAYDTSAYCFPETQTNAKGHVTSYTWDYAWGMPLTVTDPNGAVVRYVYDHLGRVKEEYGPQDTVNPKTKYNYASALTGNPNTQFVRVDHQIDHGATVYIWSKQYLDGFGRVWKEEKQAPEGKTVITERQYEWHGLLGKEWLPYFSGTTRPEPPKISVFDLLKRPTSITLPDGSLTTYAYDGLKITITDANGHVTRQIKDVHDRVVRVEQENTDGTYITVYEYDALGRQTRLLDANYNAGKSMAETVMAYDSLGRLLSRTDPYNGTTTFTYDSLGNVISKTDAKGTTLLYEYDKLNRVVAKSAREAGAPAPVLLALFDYDESSGIHGIGRLTGTRLGNGTADADYKYNAEGNVIETVKHIDSAAYTTMAEYDALGRVKKLTYPDNTTVNYTYDAEALKAVGSYAIYSAWNAAGLPGAAAYGNNADTTYTYDPRTLRLTNLRTRDAAGAVVQDFGYSFDSIGNIKAIWDNAPLTAMHTVSTSQTFSYDYLNRLTGSSVFGSYAYDKIGNITHKEGVDFYYEDPAHPYCPTRGSDGYRASYDANGNLAEKWDARGNYWRYEYDAENMLRRVYKGPDKGSEILLEEYSYGADGIRTTKKTYSGGTAATTHYVYLGNNVIYEAKPGASAKKLIWDNTRLVAEVTDDGATYNHPDHLGSTSLKTDAAGQVLSFVGTRPYGTFYNHDASKVWDEEFADTAQVDTELTTVSIEAGKAISGYTTVACYEMLHNDDTLRTVEAMGYVEVKSWSFNIVENDYRRELLISADIAGSTFPGHIKVELEKPDGSRDCIFSGSAKGTKTDPGSFSGTLSLEGLEPGGYRVVVLIAATLPKQPEAMSLDPEPVIFKATNRDFQVFLTAKRVYQPSSILRTKAFDADFDIDQITLHGATTIPIGTSVSWYFSTDGGMAWMPIEPNAQQPISLPQPARSVLLQAVLTGTETETPAVESYRLILSGSSNMVCEEGLRFTGKELDASTGLEYFGARYYDPEVGRWTTVDPAGDGVNWYSYCYNNPLVYIDPTGLLSYEKNKDGQWEWKITKGDTLTSIAKQTGFTIKELLAINPQITDRDKIYAGDTINIPQTDRIEAFQWAMQQQGSSAYSRDAKLGPGFGEGAYKCNAFVRDAYEIGADIAFPNHNGPSGWFQNCPPGAMALYTSDKIGPLVATTTPRVGDVVSTGAHCGIVGLNGTYINASSRTHTVIVTPIPLYAHYMTYTY